MLITAKKISLFCAIAAALNIMMCIMLLVYMRTADLGFFVKFCLAVYMVTASGILLGAVCAIRSSCQDLDLQYETYAESIRELKKRVQELENSK